MAFVALKVPAPSWVTVTAVALPPKVPLIFMAAVPQVFPALRSSATVGALAQPQFTLSVAAADSQAAASRHTMVWLPLPTPVKLVPDWKVPPSKEYSIPAPVGELMVSVAFPDPPEQSMLTVGAAACVPVLSQAQLVLLNTKLSQQFTIGGCGACVPVLSQAQLALLNTKLSQQFAIGG